MALNQTQKTSLLLIAAMSLKNFTKINGSAYIIFNGKNSTICNIEDYKYDFWWKYVHKKLSTESEELRPVLYGSNPTAEMFNWGVQLENNPNFLHFVLIYWWKWVYPNSPVPIHSIDKFCLHGVRCAVQKLWWSILISTLISYICNFFEIVIILGLTRSNHHLVLGQ